MRSFFDRYHVFLYSSLRQKCPYSEFFWSVFPRIWNEYGEILGISTYSVQMRENTDQKISEYGPFSRSAYSIHFRPISPLYAPFLIFSGGKEKRTVAHKLQFAAGTKGNKEEKLHN